jgi:hypothetical protein
MGDHQLGDKYRYYIYIYKQRISTGNTHATKLTIATEFVPTYIATYVDLDTCD